MTGVGAGHANVPANRVLKPNDATAEPQNPDAAEWKSIELQDKSPSWKDNIYVPLGLLGGAVALGAALVIKGKNDGRGLSQRIMEARVAAQATLLLGLVTAGYALSRSTNDEKKKKQPE